MYYLKSKQECFIGYKSRGAAVLFIANKARTASILYPSYEFIYENIFKLDAS